MIRYADSKLTLYTITYALPTRRKTFLFFSLHLFPAHCLATKVKIFLLGFGSLLSGRRSPFIFVNLAPPTIVIRSKLCGRQRLSSTCRKRCIHTPTFQPVMMAIQSALAPCSNLCHTVWDWLLFPPNVVAIVRRKSSFCRQGTTIWKELQSLTCISGHMQQQQQSVVC